MYDIWLAAVAVNTMCVRYGMKGRADWLGESSKRTPYTQFEFLTAHNFDLGEDERITVSLTSG